MGDELAQYTLDNRPLSDLITIASVNEVLTDQNLGNVKPSVPMYMYHGHWIHVHAHPVHTIVGLP